jgi:hypothetical protein
VRKIQERNKKRCGTILSRPENYSFFFLPASGAVLKQIERFLVRNGKENDPGPQTLTRDLDTKKYKMLVRFVKKYGKGRGSNRTVSTHLITLAGHGNRRGGIGVKKIILFPGSLSLSCISLYNASQ